MWSFRGDSVLSFHPTADDPVKVMTATRSSCSHAPTMGSAGPVTRLSRTEGSPLAAKPSTSILATRGALSDGLNTTAHPAAIAGPILCTTRLSEKLNGVMAATMPRGSATVSAIVPAPASAASRSEEHTSELQSRQYLVC